MVARGQWDEGTFGLGDCPTRIAIVAVCLGLSGSRVMSDWQLMQLGMNLRTGLAGQKGWHLGFGQCRERVLTRAGLVVVFVVASAALGRRLTAAVWLGSVHIGQTTRKGMAEPRFDGALRG